MERIDEVNAENFEQRKRELHFMKEMDLKEQNVAFHSLA